MAEVEQHQQSEGKMDMGVLTATTFDDGGSESRDGPNKKKKKSSSFLKGKVRDKDVLYLIDQLAIMFETGLNLVVALDCMSLQAKNPQLKELVGELKESIREGSPLWTAMDQHPKIFSPVCVNMVRAGEISGSMDDMLRQLSNYLEREMDTRSRIKSALSYPIIMLFMAFCATAFLILYVFPKFTHFFTGQEELLPIPTRMFLWIGTTCREYWHVVIGGIAVLVFAIVMILRQEKVKNAMDEVWLKIPLLRTLLAKASLSRSFHTLAVLMHGGIPILEALRVARDVSGNAVFRKSWEKVADELANGREFVSPLRANPHIPASEVEMLSLGERSGHLTSILKKLSRYYEKEIKASIKSLIKFVEPVLIVFMGAVIGIIVMSLILPIFAISRAQG